MERRKFLKGAALGAGATALATPALAQGGKTMTIVSTWPRDFPGLGISAQRLADRIGQLSDGAINVEYFAAGERVGAFDSFDEVASGNSQAYIAADYYWVGKHPAFAYFTAVPFGMTVVEWNAWVKFGGGQALWDKVAGEFGLKNLVCGATGTQAGGWFNKEINSPEDLKGLKMRIPGLGGNVMSKLGVSTVSLPGGQIYENLVSGAIDATEWVGPYNDYFMKFYEAAKYYYTAGMHEPNANLALGMNKAWWESLTDWERAVIEAASAEEHRQHVRRGDGAERPVPGQADRRAGRGSARVRRRRLGRLRRSRRGSVRRDPRSLGPGRRSRRRLPGRSARNRRRHGAVRNQVRERA